MQILWLIVLCGVLAIVFAIWATYSVLQADPGSDRIRKLLRRCARARRPTCAGNIPRSLSLAS